MMTLDSRSSRSNDTRFPEEPAMIAITALGAFTGEIVTGQYTLVQTIARTTQAGDPFKVLTLADATGDLPVYVWEPTGLLPWIPVQTPTAVQAELRVRNLHGRTIGNLQAIRSLEVHEVENAAALLNRNACPAPARPALAKLVQFVAALQPAVLRQFLNRVLFDPQIATGLTTCKGSQQHHHHGAGGLLVHSIEAMEIATAMAESRLDPTEQAIAQAAALLHDLGKLRAIGSGTMRPIHYRLASHESQTVRMLDPHLEWLRMRAPEIAAGLNYIFEYLAQPVQTRGRARFMAAQLVSYADRTSAALDDHKRLADLVAHTLPGYQHRARARQQPRQRQTAALL